MLREYRHVLQRIGPPTLRATQPAGAQFMSVYGFPPETADKIKDNHSMKGLQAAPVYSDVLYIDVDIEEHLPLVEQKLNGFRYQRWTTGNRAGHFHVPIAPMQGKNVIYSQKRWLKNAGLWDLVDTTIYHPAGQFRAPGAVHTKTGLAKTLLEDIPGTLLAIPTLIPPPVMTSADIPEAGTPEAVFQYHQNLLAVRGVGARHLHVFILVRSGLKAGIEVEELRKHIHWWNDRLPNPHTGWEIDKKINNILKGNCYG